MESAESCLVVSDLLHGSGSTRSWLCSGWGCAAASGREPGNLGWGLRSELMAAGSGGGGPGVDLGQNCCALAQSRLWSLCCLVLLLPEEHLLGSSGWVGWDVGSGRRSALC